MTRSRYLAQLARLKTGCKYLDHDAMAEAIQEILGVKLREQLIAEAHREIAERKNDVREIRH